MLDTLMTYVPVALAVLGAVVLVLKAVAPLTHTEVDNKALALLQSALSAVGKLLNSRVK